MKKIITEKLTYTMTKTVLEVQDGRLIIDTSFFSRDNKDEGWFEESGTRFSLPLIKVLEFLSKHD